jgi:hypothetical protein
MGKLHNLHDLGKMGNMGQMGKMGQMNKMKSWDAVHFVISRQDPESTQRVTREYGEIHPYYMRHTSRLHVRVPIEFHMDTDKIPIECL